MSMDLQDSVYAACANQMSDLESEGDFLQGSQNASEVAALPRTVSVIGESLCQCDRQEELREGLSLSNECLCVEEDQGEHLLYLFFL